jgi:redox-sensitive bicupin YhaK (pirin superfamily)
MGNGRVIKPGDVQYMAAGTGVLHSEFNPSRDEAVRLLQIWIQPDRKGVTPRYAEKSFAEANTGRFHLAASKSGRDGSIAIHQDAELLLAKLTDGQAVSHTLAAGRAAWLHVAEGEVTVNGTNLNAGDAAAFDAEEKIEITAGKKSQVLLFDLN